MSSYPPIPPPPPPPVPNPRRTSDPSNDDPLAFLNAPQPSLRHRHRLAASRPRTAAEVSRAIVSFLLAGGLLAVATVTCIICIKASRDVYLMWQTHKWADWLLAYMAWPAIRAGLLSLACTAGAAWLILWGLRRK